MSDSESTVMDEEQRFINTLDDGPQHVVSTDAANDIPGVADRRILVLFDPEEVTEMQEEVVDARAESMGLDRVGEVSGSAEPKVVKYVHEDRE